MALTKRDACFGKGKVIKKKEQVPISNTTPSGPRATEVEPSRMSVKRKRRTARSLLKKLDKAAEARHRRQQGADQREKDFP